MSVTSAIRSNLERRLLWTFVLAVVVYRVWNLSAYPFYEDETATIEAMKSIVRHGYALMDTGHIYWRGLLAHYLMALPLVFVDVSDHSVRLISALASGGVLLLVYRMCFDAGDRFAGWIAVIFLSVSSLEDYLAAFSRPYMLFQLTFTATAYFSARFFVDRANRSGRFLVAAAVATIGTHQLSLEIGVVCGLGLLIGARYELLSKPSFWAGVSTVAFAVLIATGIPYLLKPSWVYVNHMAMPLLFAAMKDKSALYGVMSTYLPIGLSFAAAGLIPVLSAERKAWRLYLLSFAGCMVLVSIAAPMPGLRYIGNLLPLAVVSAALTIGWLFRAAQELWTTRNRENSSSVSAALISMSLCVFLLHLAATGNWSVDEAFGRQIMARDQRPHHEYIQRHLRDGDLVISVEPWLTRAYLGRSPDFFLREKRISRRPRRFTTFSELEKSSIAIPTIDSPERLVEVLRTNPGRIWIYLNHKTNDVVSPKSKRVLNRTRLVFRKNYASVRFRSGAERHSEETNGDIQKK